MTLRDELEKLVERWREEAMEPGLTVLQTAAAELAALDHAQALEQESTEWREIAVLRAEEIATLTEENARLLQEVETQRHRAEAHKGEKDLMEMRAAKAERAAQAPFGLPQLADEEDVTRASEAAERPNYICQYCGQPSWIDPVDQTPPANYCWESDHGEPEPQAKLPLMARREWMPLYHGDMFATIDRQMGQPIVSFDEGELPADKPTYRIADTDEHGLPVIEREPGMPKSAKYRWRMKDGWWNYCQAHCPEEGLEWQRIEDFSEEQL
jgi:rubrerythrin